MVGNTTTIECTKTSSKCFEARICWFSGFAKIGYKYPPFSDAVLSWAFLVLVKSASLSLGMSLFLARKNLRLYREVALGGFLAVSLCYAHSAGHVGGSSPCFLEAAQAPSHNALRSQGCGSWHRCWLGVCFACWGFIGVYFGLLCEHYRAASVGCIANWIKNRTLHCGIKAPLFLIAGTLFLLSDARIVPIEPPFVWAFVLLGAGIAFLPEWKYARRSS